jgi:hypothetical protein
MSPYEFYATCEGYLDKIDTEAKMMRIASYRIHQSLVEKPLSIIDYWPLRGEYDVKETFVVDKEMLANIKRIHKLK